MWLVQHVNLFLSNKEDWHQPEDILPVCKIQSDICKITNAS